MESSHRERHWMGEAYPTDSVEACPADSAGLRVDPDLDRPSPPRPRPGWLVWGRLRWWVELATIAAAYLIYEASRALASPRLGPADAHGLEVLRAERWLHLDPESALNHLLTGWDWVADLAGYYYTTMHFLVTPLVLVFLWRWRPSAYPRLRSALVVTTALGLVVYVAWPCAPPRFVGGGLSDTLVQHHVLGLSNPHGINSLINQYAAMPSLHVGWALWCALAVVVTSRSPWRHLAWLYPAATTFVVLATANHFFLDVVGGAAVLAIGWVATRPRRRRTEPVLLDPAEASR